MVVVNIKKMPEEIKLTLSLVHSIQSNKKWKISELLIRLRISVADPFHFDAAPDPRIRFVE